MSDPREQSSENPRPPAAASAAAAGEPHRHSGAPRPSADSASAGASESGGPTALPRRPIGARPGSGYASSFPARDPRPTGLTGSSGAAATASGPRAFGWMPAIMFAAAIVVLAPFFVLSPLGLLASDLTPVMLIGGAIYGVVGSTLITLRWLVVPRIATDRSPADSDLPEPDSANGRRAADDRTAADHTRVDHTTADHTRVDRTAADHTRVDRTTREDTAVNSTAGDRTTGEHTAGPRSAGARSAARPMPAEPALDLLIERFATGPQRMSLAFSVVLLADLVVIASLYPQPGDGAGAWVLAACGGIAFVGAFLLIAANARWAYPRRYILAEHRALSSRTGAWQLILLNRILSYAIWLPATGIALYFSTSQHLGA